MGGAATHPAQLKPQQTQTSPPHQLHHHNRRGGGGSGGRRIHFPKGALVEVRTDEEDFKGVYFSATVISPSPAASSKKGSKKTRKIFVEYHNLLAQEEGSERLREYVEPSFVRPAPPLQEIVKSFEVDDVVDAFYKDGWWTGVVSRVLEGGQRFVVTFQNPPDELEFGLVDLRVHWDWVDGSWVRPGKQSVAGLMFAVAQKVEVSFDREACQDAWFPATIHKDLGNGTFLVEYCSATADKKLQTLKVTVDSPHVRPCPPLLKDKNFVLLEKVDAFFEYGWWSGVITKELENSRYIVFFKQTKRDMVFNESELRAHLEWKDGKWFTSSQLSQEVSIPSSDGAMHEHHTPENSSTSVATAPANNSGDRKDTLDGKSSLTSSVEQLAHDSQKLSHVKPSLAKRRRDLCDSHNPLSQPLEKLKEGSLLGACQQDTQQDTHDGSNKEMLSGSVSPVSVNNMAISATLTATGDQSANNASWGKRIRRKKRTFDTIRSVGERINSVSSSIKKSSTQMVQLESLELDVGGNKTQAAGNTAEVVQNEHAKEETELPVIIGLPCAEKGSSEFGKSRGKRGLASNDREMKDLVSDPTQQLDDSTIQDIKDGAQLEIGNFSERKRRGRPPRRKLLIANIKTPVKGNAQNGDVGSDDKSRKDDDPLRIPEVEVVGMEVLSPNQEKTTVNQDKPSNGQTDPKNRKGIMKRTSAKTHDDKVVKESIRPPENHPLKRGRRQSHNPTVEVPKVMQEAPNNDLDDEPLSKWIGAKHASTIDGSRPSPLNTVEKCTENGKEQGDTVVLDEHGEKQPESVDEVPAMPIQSLPFVKNTILWKTIESMEVFQRMPQRPHFQTLEHFKESAREGLAIGYMVTFSGVVEKTSRLQFNDPKSITDDILETLADLERHGFDVRVVRNRVNKLLAVKDKQEKLLDDEKEIDKQISERNHEKNRIEEEIRKINEHIKELQRKLALAESAKGKEDDEIASLHTRLKETAESIKNAYRDFEAIASSTF